MSTCFCIGHLSDGTMAILLGKSGVYLRKDGLDENDEEEKNE